MNGLIDDVAFEGWLALYICIVDRVPPYKAYAKIEFIRRNGKRIRWTDADIRMIERCRDQGYCWESVAEMFRFDKESLRRMYRRWKIQGRGGEDE